MFENCFKGQRGFENICVYLFMISSQNNILSLIFWLVAIIGLVPEIFQYSCTSELGLTGVQDKPVSGGVGSPKMAKFVQADVIKFLTLQADYYCFAIKKKIGTY